MRPKDHEYNRREALMQKKAMTEPCHICNDEPYKRQFCSAHPPLDLGKFEGHTPGEHVISRNESATTMMARRLTSHGGLSSVALVRTGPDSRLFQAAPQLLAALRAHHKALGRLYMALSEVHREGGIDGGLWRVEEELARAALALCTEEGGGGRRGMKQTRFRCVKCGKLTAGRIPGFGGRDMGDTSVRVPRKHHIDGKICPGVYLEAEWVDVEPE